MKSRTDLSWILPLNAILIRSFPIPLAGISTTPAECIQALSKCVDTFVNLQKQQFCERKFTIIVKDPSGPNTAEAVYI